LKQNQACVEKKAEEKVAAQAVAALGQTIGTGESAKALLFEKTIEYLMGVAGQ
jgi:hypothetical protein